LVLRSQLLNPVRSELATVSQYSNKLQWTGRRELLRLRATTGNNMTLYVRESVSFVAGPIGISNSKKKRSTAVCVWSKT